MKIKLKAGIHCKGSYCFAVYMIIADNNIQEMKNIKNNKLKKCKE